MFLETGETAKSFEYENHHHHHYHHHHHHQTTAGEVTISGGREAKQDGANCSREVVDAGHGGEGEVNVELEENIAVGKDEIERISADQSLVEDVEDQAAVVEKVLLFGLWV